MKKKIVRVYSSETTYVLVYKEDRKGYCIEEEENRKEGG